MNHFKLYDLTRLLETIVPSGIIFMVACYVFDPSQRPSEGISTMYIINLSFFVFPFLFFSIKEMHYILVGIAFSLLYVFSFDWINSMIGTAGTHELINSKFFELLTYGVGAFVLFVGLFYFKNTNTKYQEKVEQLLDETREQNEEIKQQKEEIISQRDEIETQRDKVTEQKDELEKINLDVKNSIQYAKRIQSSALPDLRILDRYFPENFVSYTPKDIVSGDFYWFAKVENKMIVTAVDCTGHGVPGAFMSMMGMSLLKEIIVKEYITKPSVILKRLRKEVIRSLNQREIKREDETLTSYHVKDGMDLALVSIDLDNLLMSFSGANNPLYVIREKKGFEEAGSNDKILVFHQDDEHAFIEVKPDKMPIGIYEKMDQFNDVEIQLQKGDKVYLFSDGFADQFGESTGKKFRYKPFKKMILENHHLSMSEQKEIFEKTYQSWKGNLKQIDDVVLIGIGV